MLLLRSLLVVGLVLGLTGFADAAKGKGKKKKGQGVVIGVAKEVQANTDKESGSLTVQPQTKAKKGQPAAPAGDPKKVTINADTKIEKVQGEGAKKKNKGQAPGTPAKLGDITANARVAVTLKSGTDIAEKVQIFSGKKAKNKNNN